MPKPDVETHILFRRILSDLLDIMEANESGTLDNRDIEYLHDYRVAVRKMRTAMGQIRQVYTADELAHFRQELSWLGSITTPVRDLDVYIFEFDELVASLAEEMHDDLLPLKGILQSQRREAQALLVNALQSSRYTLFKQTLRSFISTDIDTGRLSRNAARPAAGVGRELIRARYRKLMKQAVALKSESPDEDFHRVRKSAKKLRYLLEFFGQMFAAKSIKSLLRHLKLMQDKLGEIQDLHVQIEALRHYADIMAGQDTEHTATLLAMGALTENLRLKKTNAHDGFSACFEDFSQPEIKRRFERLFEA